MNAAAFLEIFSRKFGVGKNRRDSRLSDASVSKERLINTSIIEVSERGALNFDRKLLVRKNVGWLDQRRKSN